MGAVILIEALGGVKRRGPQAEGEGGDGGGSFAHNRAKDNGTFDLSWDLSGTPTFHHNHCGTADPSKAAWDCK